MTPQPNWQQDLAHAIRDTDSLLQYLELDPQQRPAAINLSKTVNQNFRLLVPKAYANKMNKRDWNDPLLWQTLPMDAEHDSLSGYGFDPVGDLSAMKADGLLQKYQGRVLLVTTGACAVHCRYCFRQHFPYSEANPAKQDWQNSLQWIANDDSIHEVILSGGDPLVLTDDKLANLCQRIAAIPHIKRIRFHTRLPIVLPSRINQGFLAWFATLPVNKIMVIHANHANGLCEDTAKCLADLKQAGAVLLNQSVLLKHINDNVEALSNLSERLIECQVSPYYLNLLDKVQGAAHFDVPKPQAIELIAQLRQRLSGYLIPRLVQDLNEKTSKHLIA